MRARRARAFGSCGPERASDDEEGARAYALSSVDAPLAFEVVDDADATGVVHPAWNLGALVPHFGHD